MEPYKKIKYSCKVPFCSNKYYYIEGANISIMDHNDLTPLDHAMKDINNKETYSEFSLKYFCQAYVWGTNSNYTLGTGSQDTRQLPELHDCFHKKYPCDSVRQICLDKFHCVIVTDMGSVFSCGHGQGGRLGLNTEQTILIPKDIVFPQQRPYFYCIKASIARNHSMFLSETGQVMTCGLNTHHVLGIRPAPECLLEPKLVSLHNRAVKGICASRFHSVAWGPNFIFTWGLHAGQLGHNYSDNTSYITPKLVPNFFYQGTVIVAVAASDGATVVATEKGDVFALHEYQCRKIASRQLNVVKLAVIGGHLNPKASSDVLKEKGGDELKVLVLLKNGNLLIWQESWPQLSRCIFTLNRQLIVKDVVLSKTEIFFVTIDGEAFKGQFRIRKKKLQDVVQTERKSAFHVFLDKDDCQTISITKFPHIHRAVKIECDLKGRNFAVIQKAPYDYEISDEKAGRSTIAKDMLKLLNHSDETDLIHDAVFKVSGHVFPVHKYIIAMKSQPLYSLIESNRSGNTIQISNMDPVLFKQILIYIYTNSCDALITGVCPPELRSVFESSKTEKKTNLTENLMEVDENMPAYVYYNKKPKNRFENNKTDESKNPLGLLQQVAKRFGIKSLQKELQKFIYVKGHIRYKKKRDEYEDEYCFPRRCSFNRRMFPNLCDVTIKSENGGAMSVHKCVLAARLDYFNNLFAVRWGEDTSHTTISLPVSFIVLEQLIDYLYTDDVCSLKGTDDIDNLCNVLVICDQLFIEGLKEYCEIALSRLLNLRNVVQMLQFAYLYNTSELKYYCMDFICMNLPALLETRSLDVLDEKLLDALTESYSYKIKALSKRVITPFSDAPSDEDVKHISDLFPVNIDDSSQESFEKKTPKLNTRKRTRTRKNSSSENALNKTNDSNCDSSLELSSSFNETFEEETKENKSTDEKWIKILTEKQKHEKIVQNRLRAIASAKEEIESLENNESTLIKLVSQPKVIQKNESSNGIKSPLQSPNKLDIISETAKSPTLCDIPIQKAQKLSQKQRKKLASELSVSSLARDLDEINKKPSWNNLVWSKQNNSFSDIMKGEMSTKKEDPELDIGSASPKNPWQKIEVSSPIVSPETKQNFMDIVAGEKKLKENWTKMRSRPLIYIQMEDKAISELERFYNVDYVSDEYITIHKVEKGAFAVPMWVPSNNKH